jgi:plasmid maintenance system antidote protein VapI
MLLMHGSTTSWNPTTRGTRDRDPRPTGDSYPVAENYRDQYAQAPGDIARRRVLNEARAELERWRGHGTQRHAGETQAQIDIRMVNEGEGWTVDEVSRAFHCTKSRVRTACAQHGVQIDYQDRLCRAGAVSRSSMAAMMKEAGSTQQQIADILGVHQSQVSRLIGTRRKAA